MAAVVGLTNGQKLHDPQRAEHLPFLTLPMLIIALAVVLCAITATWSSSITPYLARATCLTRPELPL